MSGLPPARVSTARRSAEWAGVASGSSRSHNAKVTFAGLVEASFSTLLGRVGFLSYLFLSKNRPTSLKNLNYGHRPTQECILFIVGSIVSYVISTTHAVYITVRLLNNNTVVSIHSLYLG